MYSETTKKLLEAVSDLEEIRRQVEEEKKKKSKKKKRKLHYLFSDKSHDDIVKLSKSQSMNNLFNESEIARAAMYIGLQSIKDAMKDDPKRARGLIHISKLKQIIE